MAYRKIEKDDEIIETIRAHDQTASAIDLVGLPHPDHLTEEETREALLLYVMMRGQLGVEDVKADRANYITWSFKEQCDHGNVPYDEIGLPS